MSIQKGDKVPSATFMTMGADGPEPIDTDTLFNGKRVALFAVPGAFTPTCSAKHLPGFKEQAEAFKAKGVDTIACTSEQQGVTDEMVMLADGNGAFAKAIGLELDASGFGMGGRSQRYAMIVDNGVLENL